MLDKNILSEIENRIRMVRDEERVLSICEQDREYLYVQLVEVVNNSILELLSVPNEPLIEG